MAVHSLRANFEILRSFAGRRSEVLNCLALLTINGKGLVAVLHLLFYMAESEYEDRPGNLWSVKGELPSEGLPTLVKLSPLHFSCNMTFRGMSRYEFEVHINALAPSHLREHDTSAHKVAQEEDEGS